MRLEEYSLDALKQGSISGITANALTDRFKNGDSHIEVSQATYNRWKDFIEVIFQVDSTYGSTDFIASEDIPQGKNGTYSVVLRFYKVKKYFKKHLKDTPYSEEANLLKFIFHNCDVKFYSDDPSWYFQGGFEDGAKAGISIYKFPGEPGDGTWHNRHAQSGGLYNSNIHLTKHMAQIVEQIDAFIPIICKSMVEQ
jgi:hypothetical protein